jgi:hypothetical protein
MSLAEIKADPIIQRALQLKEVADGAINLEKIEDEARILHESRTSRKLYKIALEPTSLAQATLKDMAHRARLSELKARVYVQKTAIEHANATCTAHIGTKYRKFIAQVATNAGDRKLVYTKILTPLIQQISEMESTLELLEIYIKDIDQAAWGLRNATEMLKLLMDNRGKTL